MSEGSVGRYVNGWEEGGGERGDEKRNFFERVTPGFDKINRDLSTIGKKIIFKRFIIKIFDLNKKKP